MAQGKYAWVFGDDDVIAPGALHAILSPFLKVQSTICCFWPPIIFRAMGIDISPIEGCGRRIQCHDESLRLADLVDTHSDLMFISSVIINHGAPMKLYTPT